MSDVSCDRATTPPNPPDARPPIELDLNLITLMEGGRRRNPKEIWLRKYGPNAKKSWWKRLLGPFAN